MTEEVVHTQATPVLSKVGEETAAIAMKVGRNLLTIPVIKLIHKVSHQIGVDTKVGLKIAMDADYFKGNMKDRDSTELTAF